MEIFGSDIIIGDFRASDFDLTLGSTDYDGSSEDEMGNDITIAEQFIGRNPIPDYLDFSYSEKLKPTATLIRNVCSYNKDMAISEYDIRNILRLITGYNNYKWMKVITDEISEDTWYKVKVISTALIRKGGRIIGLKLYMECDSQFGYSPIQTIRKSLTAYDSFKIIANSDDMYAYLLPTVTITMNATGNLQLTNETEGWTTIINNVTAGEVITMNSEREILESTYSHSNALLNDFNLHWFRLLYGENVYTSNLSCTLAISFRLKRKGGFICR